jgi:hypothetical protein
MMGINGRSHYWDAPGMKWNNIPKTWFDLYGEHFTEHQIVTLVADVYANRYLGGY